MRPILSILISFIILSSCSVSNHLWNEEIKLIQKYNMRFVEVTMNGKKGHLLIDTGASKSLLDINKAEEYGFQYLLLKKDQYIGIGGKTDIYVVFDYTVEESFIPFLAADLSLIQEYFNKDGIYLLGILGTDFLESHHCVIDFNTNKIIRKTN